MYIIPISSILPINPFNTLHLNMKSEYHELYDKFIHVSLLKESLCDGPIYLLLLR